MADFGICAAPGCDKPARQNRYKACSAHEARMRRGGSFEPRQPTKTIGELLRGKTSFGWWDVLGEGKPYERITREGGKHPDGRQRTARCRCSCGTIKDITAQTLNAGLSRNCGCKTAMMNAPLNRTHDMSGTPEYRTWAHMKERCSNPKMKDWMLYGGRGITVCDQWRDNFEAFYADMGARPDGTSIDRINVNGNYEPGNCRWATPRQQMQNVRHNRMVEYRGSQVPLIVACREVGLERRYSSIHQRMTKYGMSFADALAKEGIAA